MKTIHYGKQKIGSISMLVGALFLFSSAHATTITKTTTFNPGFFWADFTYTYSIVAQPEDIPYNDVDIALGDRTQIKISSYSGPGVAAITPGAGNTGTLVVSTAAPGGFAPAIGFSIDSVSNPTFVEGRQNSFLTLGGVRVSPIIIASAGTPIVTGFSEGDTLLAFSPGTFDALANIDLFQNNHSSLHIGYGTAATDGSALISLNEALNRNLLLIGENGQLIFETSIPEPPIIVLFLTGIVLFSSRRLG